MTPDQSHAFESVKSQKNVFITGPGGVGKSYMIKQIVDYANNASLNIAVTATTGTAALLINGTTIHSYLNIGLAKENAEILAERIIKNRYSKVATKLRKLHILVIDEISMMNAELFEKISLILQSIRKSNKPFGGLQIVLSGDLYQLPPVEGNYCFNSAEFKRAEFEICNLTTNMRQQNDIAFQNILNRMRFGEITKTDIETLKKLNCTEFPSHIRPTRLYSLNSDVDRINNSELIKLAESNKVDIKVYKPIVQTVKTIPISNQKIDIAKILKTLAIPEELHLCIGAQIVITRNLNIDEGIVNGTRAVIIEFLEESCSILVKTTSGNEVTISPLSIEVNNAIISYLPIKLAWAISIHRSQGMTLDAVEVDLGDSIFSTGQAYTALSRAKSMNSVRIVDIKPRSIKTSLSVKLFYENDK